MAVEVQDRTQAPGEERSLGELFADVTRDTSTLVRQELRLAQAEVKQQVTQATGKAQEAAVEAGRDVGMIAAGGAVAYAGLIVLLGAFALLLAKVMEPWVATLIIAVVAMAIGGLVAFQGLAGLKKSLAKVKEIKIDPVPHQTLQTLKEDVQALKGHQ